MNDQPRLLVAGGPVERRVNRTLAAVIGLMIGGGLSLGGIGVIALTTAQEVKSSRVQAVEAACKEANEHHVAAQAGLEALAVSLSPKHQAPSAAKERTIVEFTNALAPSYDCATRVRMLTKP